MRVWQVSTGEAGRDYSELFFAHDLMIIGPSECGDARGGQYANRGLTQKYKQVHRFEGEPGDRVLMRFRQKVIGVGEIPSDSESEYGFDERFRSVYGWDLRHLRRVKWACVEENSAFRNVIEACKNYRFSGAFAEVHDSEVIAAVHGLDSSYFATPLKLKPLPTNDTSTYPDDELIADLSRNGVSNENAEEILAALKRAANFVERYRNDDLGPKPREYEVVSHIVLPLFLRLGWTYEQIAVEWDRVDMAFFTSTPRSKENCVMLLEAKGLDRGLGDVLDQPRKYARDLGLKNVKHIVTTNGANLFVYENNEEFRDNDNPNPIGYLQR